MLHYTLLVSVQVHLGKDWNWKTSSRDGVEEHPAAPLLVERDEISALSSGWAVSFGSSDEGWPGVGILSVPHWPGVLRSAATYGVLVILVVVVVVVAAAAVVVVVVKDQEVCCCL